MISATSLQPSPSSHRPTEDGAPEARAPPESPTHSNHYYLDVNEEASLLLSPAPFRMDFANSYSKDLQPRFSLLRELESLVTSPDRKFEGLSGFLSSHFSLLPVAGGDRTPSAFTRDSPPPPPPKKTGGCNCRNTKCLRLNCKCFKTLGFCSPECGCLDCLNQTEFAEAREFVVAKTREINKSAFQPKAVALGSQGGALVNCQGCSCKTGCQKNYCECYRLGTGCSAICKCQQCRNATIELPREQIRDVAQVVRRTKHKIVIDAKQLKEAALGKRDETTHAKGFSIAYERYKRVKSGSRHSDSGSQSFS